VRENEGGQFAFVLAPEAVPHPMRDFRNSLNMVFRGVSERCWASVYETRVSEFRQFVEETHYDATAGTYSLTTNGWKQLGYSWNNPSFPQTGDHPVIGVNYADATNFCKWLTEHEMKGKRLLAGQSYKLPTAEEWMALAETPFPTGEEPVGNYSGPEAADARWPKCWPVWEENHDPYPRTAPVGVSTNAYLYCDLGGNAAEWCRPGLLAGGSWFDGESGDLQWLHTTNFLHRDLSRRDERNGFRVVIEDTTQLASSPRQPTP
jgi:formylglycine-generating enzyme required for sulfatase activity